MKLNAAGLNVAGKLNPRWNGGKIEKQCLVCTKVYYVKRVHRGSKFCSLKCVGTSQRGLAPVGRVRPGPPRKVQLICVECDAAFEVPLAWAKRVRCCSRICGDIQAGKKRSGAGNPNWNGGLSRLPYPWNFTTVTSGQIINRDGGKCQNPTCRGKDHRLTAHHINYDKQDCRGSNLITLCSSCNSRANFGRDKWQEFYSSLLNERLCSVASASNQTQTGQATHERTEHRPQRGTGTA